MATPSEPADAESYLASCKGMYESCARMLLTVEVSDGNMAYVKSRLVHSHCTTTSVPVACRPTIHVSIISISLKSPDPSSLFFLSRVSQGILGTLRAKQI